MKRAIILTSVLLSLSLAGCTSSRFGGSDPFASPVPQQPKPRVVQGPSDDLVDGGRGLSAGPVTSTPLDGSVSSSPVPPVSSQPITPPASMPPASAPQIAAVSPPAAPAVPRSTGNTGTWTVTDAGASCRLTLSSQSLFDLYRASPQGCSSPSLAKVNAWKDNGSEITLYEPGGKVAARLFPQGNGYGGATARGANITMSR